ncbi:MAG: type IV toxin-antitoxin system AbiEi family antitoxin domain-containing protein [Solirubrobacterales bacterium]
MGARDAQSLSSRAWALAGRQHGVVGRDQLVGLGLSAKAIRHRLAKGRLHPVYRGVYAVGRPQLTRHGRWMAAVLRCGPEAVLSHESAAALWRIRDRGEDRIEISVPADLAPRPRGVRVHRRANLGPADVDICDQIPVTSVVRTMLDLACCLDPAELEAAINAADKHELIDPESLRVALDPLAGQAGVARLRTLLDRRTFVLTDSELERMLLPIADRAGLTPPRTRQWLNGFRVDFYWPELGLVVETDGLRYHRTPAEQARDRRRDQAHAAAGLTPLRFTHAQVRYDPAEVQATLASVARRLARRSRAA